jgi:hypothetical protein
MTTLSKLFRAVEREIKARGIPAEDTISVTVHPVYEPETMVAEIQVKSATWERLGLVAEEISRCASYPFYEHLRSAATVHRVRFVAMRNVAPTQARAA